MNSTALSRLTPHERAEYWATLALRRTKGLGPRSIRRLLGHFDSAYDAVHSVARWAEAGISPEKGRSLGGDEWREAARPEWEDSRDLNGHILLWTDQRYPALLRELPDAPALLYCRGDLSLLANPCVAVVGSRACSPRSLNIAHSMACALATAGITVVSGMARGIDYAAHTGALAEQGATIAVMGAGLDVVYPPEHHDLYRALGMRGLLISEFPPGTLPQGPFFPVRNRIISGLSLGVLVVEAATRSGSLVTARLALEQNRAVYAVPPPAWDQHAAQFSGNSPGTDPGTPSDTLKGAYGGTLSLLEQGAKAALCSDDILRDLAPLLHNSLSKPEDSSAPLPTKKTKKNDKKNTPQSPNDALLPQDTAFQKLYAKVLHTEEREHQQAQCLASTPAKAPLNACAQPVLPNSRLSPRPKNVPTPPSFPKDSPEAALLDLLRDRDPLHPDDILALLTAPELDSAARNDKVLLSNMDTGSLSALLIMLEVKGALRRLPGQLYQVL